MPSSSENHLVSNSHIQKPLWCCCIIFPSLMLYLALRLAMGSRCVFMEQGDHREPVCLFPFFFCHAMLWQYCHSIYLVLCTTDSSESERCARIYSSISPNWAYTGMQTNLKIINKGHFNMEGCAIQATSLSFWMHACIVIPFFFFFQWLVYSKLLYAI